MGDLATLYKVQVPVRQEDKTRVNIRQEDKTRVNIRQEDKTRVNIRQEDKTRVNLSVRPVGADPQHTTDQAIVTRVKKAVKQLKKADVTLSQLVSDLAPVNVTSILMLPNITSQQLMTALRTDLQTEQDLCQCVGATDTAAAVVRCLCADSSEWWERSVTDHGQDTNMTDDVYERLVASLDSGAVLWPRHLYRGSDCNHPKTHYGGEN
nr:hypothetical protein BaRGS_004338 [Batillaria attramentaria]